MHKRIVYTRPNGGVSVCCPAQEAIAWMGCGGFWGNPARGFLETQIERQIARGIAADAARRFAHAMAFGGCSSQEALALIRDRDCAPHGTGCELWNVAELPRGRWFRDAWVRSHNGGPISISLRLAKPIQWQHARNAVAQANAQRAGTFEIECPQIETDWGALRAAIHAARDEHELRRVWPRELANPIMTA